MLLLLHKELLKYQLKYQLKKNENINLQKEHTILDTSTPESVVEFVKMMDRGTGSDELVENIDQVMKTFPPTEKQMQKLSILQQSTSQNSDMLSFCAATVYAIATHVINEQLPPKKESRIHTCPGRLYDLETCEQKPMTYTTKNKSFCRKYSDENN